MKLSRIIIFTRDVDRLVEFYRTAFELSEIGVATSAWAELDAGGCNLAFHKINEDSHIRDCWIKPVFGAADVPGERQRLENLGIEMSEVVTFGEIQLCDGRDPDGNWFQISSRGI
jgi:catechol 2,3-dioxygenase-like lactoylglutathione lyase family enzyme